MRRAAAGRLSRLSARVPDLLHQREFRRFWVGQTISSVGDQVSLLAIPLVGVLVLHASAAQMGYLTAVGIAPSLLFSLYAGAWLDRRGRRRSAMLTADVARALLLVSIPVAHWLGALTLAQLYVVAFGIGTFDVLFFVAYSTLFVALTRPEQYVEGNALLSGSRAASQVGGQSLAGLLVALLTAPVALLVDAASFVTSAGFLARIRPVEPPTTDPESGSLGAGARFIARSRVVRALLGATATVNYFNFVFFALFVLFAVRVLGVHAGMLGLILGVGAVGAVIGSMLTGRVTRRIGVGPAFAVSCVLFPAPLMLVPAAPAHSRWALVFLFLSEFVGGFGVMMLDISAGAILAASVPDAMRARVSGAYRTVNYGVRPLGALTGGFLADAIGLRPTLWIATIGGVACVLWLLPSPVLRMRTLDGPAGSAAADEERLRAPGDEPLLVEQP